MRKGSGDVFTLIGIAGSICCGVVRANHRAMFAAEPEARGQAAPYPA